MKKTDLFWQTYLNLEKELIEVSKYVYIGIVVAGVNAVISLLHLLNEIAKDMQQKSNRPPDQG